jgi:O-antigen ligase
VAVLAGRSARDLLLYGGALLLAVAVGTVMAYSQRFGGDSGPYMLLGALPAIAVAGAILVQWRLGVLLLAAALPYEAIITFGPVGSGIKALALLTFFSLALALLGDQKLFDRFARLWQQPLALAVFAFVLWVSASVLWASDMDAALSRTVTFLGVFGLMVVVALLERKYLVLMWVLFAFSAALSVPAGYILPVPEGSDMVEVGRFGPGGTDPNSYALLVTIAFFAAYFGVLRHRRMILYLLVPVFLYGIFATQSRTALVALVATPVLAALVPRLAARLGPRTLLLYALGAAALAVIVLAIPSVGGAAVERYASLSDPQSGQTWNGRESIWPAALQVIASHPFVGVGAGNFAEFTFQQSTYIASKSAEAGEVAGVAHNIILGVTSELGFVGLILFLGVLFFAFKGALPIAQGSDLGLGIFLGLIVFIIAGMTLQWEYHKIGYVLFGSVLALQLQRGHRASLPDEREDTY